MILYTPIGFTVDKTRNDGLKRKAIFDNKLRIIQQASKQGDEYFIIKDLDIIYGYGIKEMEIFLNDNPDYGAVALWPHSGPIEHSFHVSTSFMMIRRDSVYNLEMTFKKGCFCHNFCDVLRSRDFKVKYIEGKILH